MSGKGLSPKSKNKSKKERKKKRQATSPLFEYKQSPVQSVNTCEHNKGQRKKCKSDNATKIVSDFYSNLSFTYDPNMSFQTQAAQFGMPQQQPQQQQFMQSPPPSQLGPFGFQVPNPSTAPPPWAAKLLEDMEYVKEKLKGMDKIEKTVNMINAKVSDLETKMKDMDTRLITNEKACEFVAKEHEQSKTEMKAAKGDMKNIKQTCEKLEREANSMKEKMVDLESRSMRENLMFYGIAEQGKDEDCEQLVKNVCKESLKIATADSLLFDRAHRVGTKSGSKVRPIVVKFHYYHERELVRKRSFDYGEALKGQNLGIGRRPGTLCNIARNTPVTTYRSRKLLPVMGLKNKYR